MIDVLLGIAFIIIITGAFACSYFFILHRPDNPTTQHIYLTIVCYGYIQSLLGFVSGLWLSRITQVGADDSDEKHAEEEMLLIEETIIP